MNHFPKLEEIKASCEKAFYALEQLNPEHELMGFDGTGLCSQLDKAMLLDLLLVKFGPRDHNSDCPTDEELCGTFQSLQNALDTAIAIERAKAGMQHRPH